MFIVPPTMLGFHLSPRTFESQGGGLASHYYAPGWFRAVDHFALVAPFLDMAETSTPQVTEGTADTVEGAWTGLLALDDPLETMSSIDNVAWKPACFVTPFALLGADVSLCADTSSGFDYSGSDDSFDIPTTPTADLSIACDSAASIFIDGEVIPTATPEDRQLAFKQRVLARAGLMSPSPAPRSSSSGTDTPVTGSSDTDSPGKALSASARSFTPSAETVAFASYMRRNPGDARGTAKLLQMRARAQACVG